MWSPLREERERRQEGRQSRQEGGRWEASRMEQEEEGGGEDEGEVRQVPETSLTSLLQRVHPTSMAITTAKFPKKKKKKKNHATLNL